MAVVAVGAVGASHAPGSVVQPVTVPGPVFVAPAVSAASSGYGNSRVPFDTVRGSIVSLAPDNFITPPMSNVVVSGMRVPADATRGSSGR